MRLYEVIWKDKFVDKIEGRHKVTTDEVEEVLFSKPHTRRAEKGHVRGEDLYVAYAQTHGGRYLVVVFCPQASERCFALFSARHEVREGGREGGQTKLRTQYF